MGARGPRASAYKGRDGGQSVEEQPAAPESANGGTSGAPPWKPLLEPSVPAKGDEDNPVYRWHNDFLHVGYCGAGGSTAYM